MPRNLSLQLRKYFLILSIFVTAITCVFVLVPNAYAQTCDGWRPTQSSVGVCSTPLFDSNCNGNGSFSGLQCCQFIGYDTCQSRNRSPNGITIPLQEFRCCFFAPTPTPTSVPTPTPTFTPTPTPVPPTPTPTTAPCDSQGGTYFCTSNTCDYYGNQCFQSSLYTCLNSADHCCFNTCPIPTPTPTPCVPGLCGSPPPPTPTFTPTPTPTGTPKVTIQGRNVDANGTPLTTNIGQTVIINGSNYYNTNNSPGIWSFTSIPAGTYIVTATVPSGYNLSYSYSGKNISPPTAPYTAGSSLSVTLPNNGDWADIYFRYAPTSDLCAQYTFCSGTGSCTSATNCGWCINGPNGFCKTGSPSGPSDGTTCSTWAWNPGQCPVVGSIGSSCTNSFQCLSGYCDPATGTCQNPPQPTVPPGTCQLKNLYNSGGNDTCVECGTQNCPNGCCYNYFYCSGQKYTYVCQTSGCVQTPSSCPVGQVCYGYAQCAVPTPTPVPTYSISGVVYIDTNNDGSKGANEAIYGGNVTINGTSYTRGTYNITGLHAGPATISYTNVPANYQLTYPTSGSFNVTVGYPGCSVLFANNDATCSNGNIINLNFGINTSSTWIQSTGGDMRVDSDSGFTDPMPASGLYASAPGLGGMPGIIFSGKSLPTFGQGSASQNFNWQVGGSLSNPLIFAYNPVPTSYGFLLGTAQGSGITPTPLSDTQCGPGNLPTACNLSSSLANGIYIANSSVTLTSNSGLYTFPQNKNFIILVNGDLTINEKIQVPVGSSVIFSVSGKITVNQAIGETAATSCSATTHAGCDMEGLYSADGSFVADQTDSCPGGTHNRLNIAGSVIANAARSGGSFVNKRDLCGNNASYPSVSFTERPDFILNYPRLAQQISRTWQNVAP